MSANQSSDRGDAGVPGVPETSPEAIALAVARDEIRRLPLAYAYAQDTKDADLLLSLWAEPDPAAPAEYPDMDLITVRKEHQRWFTNKGTCCHFVGNHLITIDGPETAHGDVYCMAQLDFRDQFVDQTILYQDNYVKIDGRWLFATRRHLLFFGQARAENPMEQEGEGWPKVHTGAGNIPAIVQANPPRHR